MCSAGKLHNLPFFCVHDAGLTEVEPNSFTALAFFGSDDQLIPITGKLRLLKWIKKLLWKTFNVFIDYVNLKLTLFKLYNNECAT